MYQSPGVQIETRGSLIADLFAIAVSITEVRERPDNSKGQTDLSQQSDCRGGPSGLTNQKEAAIMLEALMANR